MLERYHTKDFVITVKITRQLYILAQAEAWIASKKQSLREEARNIISQTDKQDEDLRALTRIILGLAKT